MYESFDSRLSPDDEGKQRNGYAVSQKTTEQTCAKILGWEWRLFLVTFSFGLFSLAIYMISFYVRSILGRNLAAWDIVFPGMYHVDNVKSQIGLGVHFIGGAYFVLMAPLQYVPWFRRNYSNFHRWNGRVAVTLLGITVVEVQFIHGKWGSAKLSLNIKPPPIAPCMYLASWSSLAASCCITMLQYPNRLISINYGHID
eukprot:scaffold12339_cov75-Skeletonema_dohrnii-CCMP3373.AAC.2